jgi:hypothetical protein
MGTDSKLAFKANTKEWKGLMGGAGGDVRGGAQGALLATNSVSRNRQNTEGTPGPSASVAKSVATFSEEYDKEGVGNVAVDEVADTLATVFTGAELDTFSNTPVALGDSYFHMKYLDGDLGIDDLGGGSNSRLGLGAVGTVGINAPSPGTTDVDLDWVVAGAAPDNFDPTGASVRVVVRLAEDIGGIGDNAPQTPFGDPSDAPRGILAPDGTLVQGVGGIVGESVTAVATQTTTIAGLVAATSYAIGLRVEAPSGSVDTSGDPINAFGPWSWQSFTTGA